MSKIVWDGGVKQVVEETPEEIAENKAMADAVAVSVKDGAVEKLSTDPRFKVLFEMIYQLASGKQAINPDLTREQLRTWMRNHLDG